jgi:CheY-like chemotaxis protein
MEAMQTAPKQKLVFVCDDDNDIAEVTKLVIEKQQHEVRVFSVCEDIVNAAEQHQPALILLDLWMPEMGGEKVIGLLKKNPRTKDIPVYVFSATRDVASVVKRAGADGFLNKPYSLRDMDNLLKKVLG